MRLWSIHPRYLDAAGLVACWREALLARAVVAGHTVGYRHHPQLERFYGAQDPLDAVEAYLEVLFDESLRRGYCFDASKIRHGNQPLRLSVTDGQLAYEFGHLKQKLKIRSPHLCAGLEQVTVIDPHPLFEVRQGDVEKWEIIR